MTADSVLGPTGGLETAANALLDKLNKHGAIDRLRKALESRLPEAESVDAHKEEVKRRADLFLRSVETERLTGERRKGLFEQAKAAVMTKDLKSLVCRDVSVVINEGDSGWLRELFQRELKTATQEAENQNGVSEPGKSSRESEKRTNLNTLSTVAGTQAFLNNIMGSKPPRKAGSDDKGLLNTARRTQGKEGKDVKSGKGTNPQREGSEGKREHEQVGRDDTEKETESSTDPATDRIDAGEATQARDSVGHNGSGGLSRNKLSKKGNTEVAKVDSKVTESTKRAETDPNVSGIEKLENAKGPGITRGTSVSPSMDTQTSRKGKGQSDPVASTTSRTHAAQKDKQLTTISADKRLRVQASSTESSPEPHLGMKTQRVSEPGKRDGTSEHISVKDLESPQLQKEKSQAKSMNLVKPESSKNGTGAEKEGLTVEGNTENEPVGDSQDRISKETSNEMDSGINTISDGHKDEKGTCNENHTSQTETKRISHSDGGRLAKLDESKQPIGEDDAKLCSVEKSPSTATANKENKDRPDHVQTQDPARTPEKPAVVQKVVMAPLAANSDLDASHDFSISGKSNAGIKKEEMRPTEGSGLQELTTHTAPGSHKLDVREKSLSDHPEKIKEPADEQSHAEKSTHCNSSNERGDSERRHAALASNGLDDEKDVSQERSIQSEHIKPLKDLDITENNNPDKDNEATTAQRNDYEGRGKIRKGHKGLKAEDLEVSDEEVMKDDVDLRKGTKQSHQQEKRRSRGKSRVEEIQENEEDSELPELTRKKKHKKNSKQRERSKGRSGGRKRKRVELKEDAEYESTHNSEERDLNSDSAPNTRHASELDTTQSEEASLKVPEDYEDQKKIHAALRELLSKEFSYPFSTPVDPNDEGCSSYLDEIKNPMDLGTICTRLDATTEEKGFYKTPTQIMDDIELVWSNCQAFNGEFDPVCYDMKSCMSELPVLMARYGVSSKYINKRPARRSRGRNLKRSLEEEVQSQKSSKKRKKQDEDDVNDGRLLGQSLIIFAQIDGKVKSWRRAEVLEHDRSARSYTLKWAESDKTISKATFGKGCMFPVYRDG